MILQSLAFHRSPTPQVSSTEASSKTLKRQDNLKDQITSTSEDTKKLLQPEMILIPMKGRQELLSEAGRYWWSR